MKKFKAFFDLDICTNIPLIIEAETIEEATNKALSLSDKEKYKKFIELYKDDQEFLANLITDVSLQINPYYELEEV